jgi:hypothetical protein
VPWPYQTPSTLPSGYQLVGLQQGHGYIEARYDNGRNGMTLFEQAGSLATSRLPAGAQPVAVKAGARQFDWPGGGQALVWDAGSVTYTLVVEAGTEALEPARGLPPGRSPSRWQRMRKAARGLVDEFSGSR